MKTIHITYTSKEKINYWRQPTKGELKFGNGAIHWRSFERHECSKPNGDLKKWFIADDGLRYNY